MSRLPTLVAVPVLALALAACGDDGPSREDFIADADAICERLNERIAEVNEDQPTNLEELQSVLDEGIELTDEGLEEFEELEVPEEIEDDVDDYLESARDQREALERARNADSVEESVQILREEVPEIAERREELADEIGFEECGAS